MLFRTAIRPLRPDLLVPKHCNDSETVFPPVRESRNSQTGLTFDCRLARSVERCVYFVLFLCLLLLAVRNATAHSDRERSMDSTLDDGNRIYPISMKFKARKWRYIDIVRLFDFEIFRHS